MLNKSVGCGAELCVRTKSCSELFAAVEVELVLSLPWRWTRAALGLLGTESRVGAVSFRLGAQRFEYRDEVILPNVVEVLRMIR